MKDLVIYIVVIYTLAVSVFYLVKSIKAKKFLTVDETWDAIKVDMDSLGDDKLPLILWLFILSFLLTVLLSNFYPE